MLIVPASLWPLLAWAQVSAFFADAAPYSKALPARVELGIEVAPTFRVALKVPESALLMRKEELNLRSAAALVLNQDDGELLYAKNPDAVMPIASLTKLMTAMVVLDSGLTLDDPITIMRNDLDKLQGTGSRLRVGVTLPRREMLRLALMASENLAAAALARAYPGGTTAFVEAMNHKAKNVGMRDTRYVDATGLNPNNVSTAQDLALLVNAGYRYPLLRDYSTTDSVSIPFGGERTRRALVFRNSNGLIRSGQWEIGLQKTGYIRAAGRCLAMQARISDKSVIIVLLDSFGKHTRIADANRIRRWIEALPARLSAPVWHGLNAPSGFSLNATAEGGYGRQVLSVALPER
jgi:D-alanyl-D-alanine endopeptidase (penicillin-binding protein 7)